MKGGNHEDLIEGKGKREIYDKNLRKTEGERWGQRGVDGGCMNKGWRADRREEGAV